MDFVRSLFRSPKLLATLIVAGAILTWLGFGQLQQPALGVLGVVLLIVAIGGGVLAFASSGARSDGVQGTPPSQTTDDGWLKPSTDDDRDGRGPAAPGDEGRAGPV